MINLLPRLLTAIQKNVHLNFKFSFSKPKLIKNENWVILYTRLMGHILLRNPTILKPFLVIFASKLFWTMYFVNVKYKSLLFMQYWWTEWKNIKKLRNLTVPFPLFFNKFQKYDITCVKNHINSSHSVNKCTNVKFVKNFYI